MMDNWQRRVILSLLCCVFVNALIHDLEIENDNRKKFFIENFGFEANGVLEMKVLNFKVLRNIEFDS